MKQKFDLTRAVGSQLVFEHRIDTEPGYDLCLVEARAKGKNWTTLAVFSGTQTTFEPVTIDLSEFDGQKGVKIRFSLVSDPFVNGDGWYIANGITLYKGHRIVAIDRTAKTVTSDHGVTEPYDKLGIATRAALRDALSETSSDAAR